LPSALRIVFMGSPPFADQALAALLDAGHNVVAVVSSPPSRRGRGRQLADNSVVRLAQQHSVAVLQPLSAKDAEFKEQFAKLNCDLAVVVSYGQILDAELLALPKLGCINVHASLLPRWRGASPIQSAIRAGDNKSGVCIQKMVLALDAGDVLASNEIMLSNESTGPWLFDQCATLGAKLVNDFVSEVNRTKKFPEGQPQDAAQITHCSKVKKSDGEIDWSHPAEEVYRQIRASLGWPGAFSKTPSGDNLKIHAAQLCADQQLTGEAGEVKFGESGQLYVCCDQGAIELLEVQRAGKSRISAKEFINGNSISASQKLGASL
jgi:methionyl-tRNA formyltransferase